MCGIGGVIYKTPDHEKKSGEVILSMLESLCQRGPDSAGVALLHPKEENVLYIDVTYEKEGGGEKILSYLHEMCRVIEAADHRNFVRAKVEYEGEEVLLTASLNQLDDDIAVAGYGEQLEVLKYLGEAQNLDTQFDLSAYDGQIAVGHTRMATESKVDISHSQPLCCDAGKDLTIIHNGHITNYVDMRHEYEAQGYIFQTGNDSEVIAVYLADKMKNGMSLEGAMNESLEELDGSFNYVAVTPEAVGLVKEPFGMKPMVLTETEDYVMFASESQAIAGAVNGDVNVWEPGTEEVLVWNL